MLLAIRYTDSSAKFVCASQPAVHQSPSSAEPWTCQQCKNLPIYPHINRPRWYMLKFAECVSCLRTIMILKKNKDNCIRSNTSTHYIKNWKWIVKKWNASRVQLRYLEGACVHTYTQHNLQSHTAPGVSSRRNPQHSRPSMNSTILRRQICT
jgi:hypothetical protein